MPVVAVVNRKGGSGKSTLATHLAAYCAHKGLPVLLGDADFQQSSHAWLRYRERQRLVQAPKIAGWAVDPRNILRAPNGVTHVVLDTPGGLKGFELMRVLMLADAVLIPVCNSMFDRESAAECLAELQAHPRVAKGRCKIAAVGMRLDGRTKAEASLRAWAEPLNLPFLTALRETQTYVKCLDHGLTIFDMPAARVEADLLQWRPILEWVDPIVQPLGAVETKPARRPTRPVVAPGSQAWSGLRSAPMPLDAPATAAVTVEPRTETPVLSRVAVRQDVRTDPRPPLSPAVVARPSATKPVSPDPLPKIHRMVPAREEEDLDSRFGGLTTRIGRWLEMLSPKRAR